MKNSLQSTQLSLFEALFININIMLGSGVFINTVILSSQAGAASPLVYLTVGLLFFPLIYTIAQFFKQLGAGTFYDFGKIVHPSIGFISSWSYFTAKMASSVLSMHVFVTLMQQIFPALLIISPLYYDLLLIGLFVWLNSFNLKLGSSIQFYFILLKMVPLLFVCTTGFFLFNNYNFALPAWNWSGMPISFPLVIFAFSGFEASCSLSKNIKNPEKNGPRALFFSYALVLFLAIFYQIMFYGSLGIELEKLTGFTQAFPLLCLKFPFSEHMRTLIVYSMHIGIATSALGASYGIMYSNAWNLYALADNKHIMYSSFFTRLNKQGVPFGCILTEGFLAVSYIIITQGQQVLLQQISALGSTIAYTLSVIACIILYRKRKIKLSPFFFLALISCSVFIGSLIYAYLQKGAHSLILFVCLFCFGIVNYLMCKK